VAERPGARDSCPCNSGKATGECCFQTDGTLFRRPVIVTVQRPPRPAQQPGCYGAALQDCGGGIDREHYISRSLQKIISTDGKMIRVGGLALPQDIPIEGFCSKVLCHSHNVALSDLDSMAADLFRTLTGFMNDAGDRRYALFNGEDIERWMIKLMFGCAAARVLTGPRGRAPEWHPPLEWLEILESWAPRKRSVHRGERLVQGHAAASRGTQVVS